jgi:hypothetical protein
MKNAASQVCKSRGSHVSLVQLERVSFVYIFHVHLDRAGFCAQGSYEKIGDICKKESLPANYMAIAKAHALDGCYVLGLAHRCGILLHMMWQAITLIKSPFELRASKA